MEKGPFGFMGIRVESRKTSNERGLERSKLKPLPLRGGKFFMQEGTIHCCGGTDVKYLLCRTVRACLDWWQGPVFLDMKRSRLSNVRQSSTRPTSTCQQQKVNLLASAQASRSSIDNLFSLFRPCFRGTMEQPSK